MKRDGQTKTQHFSVVTKNSTHFWWTRYSCCRSLLQPKRSHDKQILSCSVSQINPWINESVNQSVNQALVPNMQRLKKITKHYCSSELSSKDTVFLPSLTQSSPLPPFPYLNTEQHLLRGSYSWQVFLRSSLDAAPPRPVSPFMWGLPRKPPAGTRASLVHQIQGCHPHWGKSGAEGRGRCAVAGQRAVRQWERLEITAYRETERRRKEGGSGGLRRHWIVE